MSLQVVMDFRVLDESGDWIVVDKPAPLIVHPANRKPEPTLLGGVEQLLAYEMRNGATPAVVNRLDRDTSGVVVVAKHALAARKLGMAFQQRETRKEYLAIVHGWPQADGWECSEPILRAGEVGDSRIWVRQIVHPAGRVCSTKFQLDRRFERGEVRFSLLRCFPETGRMHQIRVHLAHCGFPIVGDKLYRADGSEYLQWMEEGWTAALESRLLLPRHALHASRLGLPWDGSWLDWEAVLPRDLQDFVDGKGYHATAGTVIWSRHDP